MNGTDAAGATGSAASDADVRRIVAEAFEGTSAGDSQRDARIHEFVEGRHDVRIDALGMDSLDVMEFCISIELATGVSIVPDDLERIGTLARLAAEIGERRP